MDFYDVAVIGAGTAGLKAAQLLKDNNANYVIVEKGEGGTLCADTGCMPSKALIEAAHAFHVRKRLDTLSVDDLRCVIADIPSVLEHVRTLRDGFVKGVREGMKAHPVIYSQARFVDEHTLHVGDKTIRAEKILICSGSTPRIPSVFDAVKDHVLTTDTLFEQEDLPPSLAVVGVGSIGAEMGQALARLGVEIFVLEPGEAVAGISDGEVNAAAQDILKNEMRLYMNTHVTKAERFNGCFRLLTNRNTIEVSGVLVSAGRVPNVHGLGLETLSIDLGDDGVPEFDRQSMQIGDMPIYIAGDVNNERSLQHEAAAEGERAARHALGLCKDKPERDIPLAITFTDPPKAFVGRSGALRGAASYENQGRATLMQEDYGVAKLYAAKDGVLTGAEMIAPAADHMAHFLLLAVHNKMNAKDLLDMPFYHPTLEEGLRKALA
ncbi:MAG: dihydrolipoyl dehydrogenase, partial [Alphaproteobacteria bacterium]